MKELPFENGSTQQRQEPSSVAFELNIQATSGFPTLVPSLARERHLDFRLLAAPQYGSLAKSGRAPDLGLSNARGVAIHIHCYYIDELSPILRALENCIDAFPADSALFLTTDTEEKRDQIISLITDSGLADKSLLKLVKLVENRGRNLRPLFHDIYPLISQYDVALHLHAKRSVGNSFGRQWLLDMLDSLIPSTSCVDSILSAFRNHPELGLIMPQAGEVIRPLANWGSNFLLARMLSATIFPDRILEPQAPLVFPAGMMFWFRPVALQQMANACTRLVSFVSEPVAPDGTLLHALERLSAHFCEAAGYRWALAVSNHDTSLDKDAAKTFLGFSVWAKNEDAYLHATRRLIDELKGGINMLRLSIDSLGTLCEQQSSKLLASQEEDLLLCQQLDSALGEQVKVDPMLEARIGQDALSSLGREGETSEMISLRQRLDALFHYQAELRAQCEALELQSQEDRQELESSRRHWDHEREQSESRLRTQQLAIADLELRVQEATLQLAEQVELLDSRHQELSELQSRYQQGQHDLNKLREIAARYQQAKNQISDLNSHLANRDEQISALQSQCRETVEQCEKLSRDLIESRSEISRLEDQIQAERMQRSVLQTQLQKSFRHRIRSIYTSWSHRLMAHPLLSPSKCESQGDDS